MKRFENKQTSLLCSSDLKTVKGQLVYWSIILILIIFSIIALVPAVWTILTAFKDTQEMYSSFSFWPKDFTWAKLISRITDAWIDLELGSSIINTFIMSIGNWAMTIVVCGFGGYVLSKLRPRGTKLVFMLVVWTMMMPWQMRIVPNYISYLHFPFAYDIGGVSLLDTYWPMWLSAAANAFNIILFKNSFDSLSQTYVEAARLDGCGNFGIFFKIMFPLSLPVVIYVSVVTLSGAWSEFFTPLLVLDKNQILPVKIYRLQADTSIPMNNYFMGLMFASLPPFLIFCLFQKHIMGGVNIGGVKG